VCVTITTVTDNIVCAAGGNKSAGRPRFQPALNTKVFRAEPTGNVIQFSSSLQTGNTARKLWDEYGRK
jgi:hypothetical protein